MLFSISRNFRSFLNMGQFDYKKIMTELFFKSVMAVNPAKLIAENVKLQTKQLVVCDKVYNINNGNIYLVGFGKAVLGMACQCEKILGTHLKRGVICVPENIQNVFKNNNEFCLIPNSVIKVFEGAKNNLPDEKAEKGTDAVIGLIKSINHKIDILIVLISGGGSALFTKPKPGLLLAEKLKVITLLASSGADITELNTVRKKLSAVKGGGLARLTYPIRTVSLILSDVIDNPLEIIASGPTVPNFDLETAAFDVIKKYNLENKVSETVLDVIKEVSSEDLNVSLVDGTFPHVDNILIGTNARALNACKDYAKTLGFDTVMLSMKINGLIENIANFYINMVLEILNSLYTKQNCISEKNLFEKHIIDVEENFINEMSKILDRSTDSKPICVIAGGEITVKLQGSGKGGRNQELALTISQKLYESKIAFPHLFEKYDVAFLSAGTDGIDGPTDVAGAIGEAYVIEKAKEINLQVNEFISNNDSYNFFKKIENGSYLIKSGHTGTNVMDVHSFLIYNKAL